MSTVTRKAYPFDEFEPRWQRHWEANRSFHAPNPGDPDFDAAKPKFYALDMFPYPSGDGLHVGHPEGYTATDIVSRSQRKKGFNVLHPMGWDAFGLPAEQYAIKTGQHPRATTERNVARFRTQLQSLGFAYDWQREVNTTDPRYFKWTQWIFLQMYHSWFNPATNKAEPIATYPGEDKDSVRLAYVAEVPVNWCPGLGTVLANEEVVDGKSEVGGFPVERRPMKQWMLRITAYAERLIDELADLDWSESIKLRQRDWIGRSEGADVDFPIRNPSRAERDSLPEAARRGVAEATSKSGGQNRITVFTTRPDTLYGATYMVLAPEHPLVDEITAPAQREAVEAYRREVASKSDLERTALAKHKTGVHIGAFAINPVNNEEIPIWIADYVLMGYGTGAIMAVPAHDERDFEFATQFHLPIRQVVASQMGTGVTPVASPPAIATGETPVPLSNAGEVATGKMPVLRSLPLAEAFVDEGISVNSPLIDGLPTPKAKERITAWLEEHGLGKKAINYKLRDWLFARQRYWGEPFPIVWENGRHRALPESELPVVPPELDDFRPTGTPDPPLAKASDWVRYSDKATRELNTMPQWAGSCWYYLRFCDPRNDQRFVGEEAERYWMTGDQNPKSEPSGARQPAEGSPKGRGGSREQIHNPQSTGGVDLYVGGTEHAVLHLLYSRFWHKVLFDLGHVSTGEPFQKLVNQGLILGEDGQKMSKSRGNVINPDAVIADYGADSLRLFEMFMGPLEAVKPWSTKGVEGVYRFLARVWRLALQENQQGEWVLSEKVQVAAPTKRQLKVVHATIKKVAEDCEALSFNTAIAQMMVCCNELTGADPLPLDLLVTFLHLLNPYAPHLTEEVYLRLRTKFQTLPEAVLSDQPSPEANETFLAESEIEIVIQVNGKLRDKAVISADAGQEAHEAAALASAKVQEHTRGKTIRKVIVVPKKLVNVVAN